MRKRDLERPQVDRVVLSHELAPRVAESTSSWRWSPSRAGSSRSRSGPGEAVAGHRRQDGWEAIAHYAGVIEEITNRQIERSGARAAVPA